MLSPTVSALAHRLHEAGLDLLAIVAPAGFGKTRLASELMAMRGRGTFCALKDAGERGIARLVIEALVAENPEGSASLGESLIAGAENLKEIAEAAWIEPPSGPSVFAFDDVDAEMPDADLAFVSALLTRCPPQRRVVLCSRHELPRNLTRHVPPHRYELVDAASLRMSGEDLVRLSPGLTEETARRIIEAAAGWPIAALLFLRMQGIGWLDASADLGRGSYDSLIDYLTVEYFETLEEQYRQLLRAAWAIPSVTAQELAMLLTLPAARVERFARTCPFITLTGAQVAVHALLRSAFDAASDLSREDVLRWSIERFAAETMFRRAAECAMALPDANLAADLLQDIPRDSLLRDFNAISAILSALDRDAILSRPRLYLATVNIRRFMLRAEDAIAEARRVFYALKARCEPELEVDAARTYARLLVPAGRLDDAVQLLDEVVERLNDLRLTWPLALYRAGILASLGRTRDAQATFESLAPYAVGSELASALSNIASTVAARSGRPEEAIANLEEAARLQRESGAAASLVLTLANIAFELFVSGEDERFKTAVSEAKASLMPGFEPAWSFWLGCASGRDDVSPSGLEPPALLIQAYLFRSVRQGAAAREAAFRAYDEAKRSAGVLAKVLGAIACAERVPETRADMMEALSALAETSDVEAFRDATQRYVGGQTPCGVLEPFVQRFRRELLGERVRIELTSGRVTSAGADVALSLRERAVLAYLASSRRYRSREAVCDAIWPDLERENAANNLKVTVYRIRKKLGNATLASVRDGYCVGAEVDVDLEADEAFVRSLRTAASCSAADEHRLRAICTRSAGRPDDLARWDWYVSLDQRLQALARDAALIVARSALASRRSAEAFAVGTQLLRDDAGDEAAVEILIRSQLIEGDTAAARATLRHYERVLKEDLGVAVSENLRKSLAALAL